VYYHRIIFIGYISYTACCNENKYIICEIIQTKYFKRKYQEWTLKEIKSFDCIYIDGSNAWHSSGSTRWNKGWEEADGLMQKLEAKNVINNEKEQMKRIFFITHSMGAAHAEGIISSWKYRGLQTEQALHFSAADNNDFFVCFPSSTYQINFLPDIVLAYKNNDDAALNAASNLWQAHKEMTGHAQEKEKFDLYKIKNLPKNHYIICYRNSVKNHADTKFDDVWHIVPF
jgi:hypothetical protein